MPSAGMLFAREPSRGGQKQQGEVRMAAVQLGGNPPAGELRRGRLVRAEVDEFVGIACNGLRACACARGVQHELPLSLIEENAEGDVGAEQRGEQGESESFDEPRRTDHFRLRRRRRAAGLCLRGRAGHECASVATLALGKRRFSNVHSLSGESRTDLITFAAGLKCCPLETDTKSDLPSARTCAL